MLLVCQDEANLAVISGLGGGVGLGRAVAAPVTGPLVAAVARGTWMLVAVAAATSSAVNPRRILAFIPSIAKRYCPARAC